MRGLAGDSESGEHPSINRRSAPVVDPGSRGVPVARRMGAPNTPGKRVPSHGTDMLGQRYAYDFVRTDPPVGGMRFHNHSTLRYLILGVRLQDCFGWGQPIHSPVSGTVVQARGLVGLSAIPSISQGIWLLSI